MHIHIIHAIQVLLDLLSSLQLLHRHRPHRQFLGGRPRWFGSEGEGWVVGGGRSLTNCTGRVVLVRTHCDRGRLVLSV